VSPPGLAVTPTRPLAAGGTRPRPDRRYWPFTDDRHGFLVGQATADPGTEDGGASCRSVRSTCSEGDNYACSALTSRAGGLERTDSPACLLRNRRRRPELERHCCFDTQTFPGEPYLRDALGAKQAELATSVGAILPNGTTAEPAGGRCRDGGRERP